MLSRWSVPYFIMKEREILKLLKILPVGGLARKIIERSAKDILLKDSSMKGGLGRSGESFNNESKETLRLFKKEKGDTQKFLVIKKLYRHSNFPVKSVRSFKSNF